MQMKNILSWLFLAGILNAGAATNPLAVMPFTYVGRVVDSSHVAFDGEQSVELRLKNLSGGLLAKCTTYTSITSPYNYRLDVPMATTATAGCATNGQFVAIELVDTTGAVWAGLVPPSKCAVGEPGGLCRCNIVVAADANGNGVADDYEEYMAWLMFERGIEGAYDPLADSDGDGASNYAEYVAGTDPFDAKDTLGFSALDALKGKNGETLAFTFLANAGRVYSVSETPILGQKAAWSAGTFKTAPESATEVKRLATGSTGTGWRTIYLTRKPEAASGFYRLNVE